MLYHHMSHLSTLQDREDLMRPFYSVCASRMSTLLQITQLHARLDLILTHVATRHQEIQQDSVEPEALLMYRDGKSLFLIISSFLTLYTTRAVERYSSTYTEDNLRS